MMFKTGAALLLLDVLPPTVFIFSCVGLAMGWGSAAAVLAVAACLVALLRGWTYRRELVKLDFDTRLANYEAIGALLLSLLLMNSAWAHRVSRGIQWKGRKYATKRR